MKKFLNLNRSHVSTGQMPLFGNGMEEEDDALTIVRSGMHRNIRGKKYYAQAGGIR